MDVTASPPAFISQVQIALSDQRPPSIRGQASAIGLASDASKRVTLTAESANVSQRAESASIHEIKGVNMSTQINRIEERIDRHGQALSEVRERTARIEVDLKHKATNEKLANTETKIIKWVVGTAIAVAAIAVAATAALVKFIG